MTEAYQGPTPPPELVKQWVSLACEYEGNETWIDLATQAARWGADQELEACCEWVANISGKYGPRLRISRRPKPPSLAEEALETFMQLPLKVWGERDTGPVLLKIRRALERLQELEGGND